MEPIGKGGNWPADKGPSKCLQPGGDPSWPLTWDTHFLLHTTKEGEIHKILVPVPKRYHGRRGGPPAKSCKFHACKPLTTSCYCHRQPQLTLPLTTGCYCHTQPQLPPDYRLLLPPTASANPTSEYRLLLPPTASANPLTTGCYCHPRLLPSSPTPTPNVYPPLPLPHPECSWWTMLRRWGRARQHSWVSAGRVRWSATHHFE